MTARLTDPVHWSIIRRRILLFGEMRRYVAQTDRLCVQTIRKVLASESPPVICLRKSTSSAFTAKQRRVEIERQQWMQMLYHLEHGKSDKDPLLTVLFGLPQHLRRRAITVIAHQHGFSNAAICTHLGPSLPTIRRYFRSFAAGGVAALLKDAPRSNNTEDESFKKILFGLLHQPPSLSGFNRTTWRLEDLRKMLADKAYPTGVGTIRLMVRKAGFRWKSAKVVLTSTDPAYHEKLERIQTILSHLGTDERFFSIDEYGPFSVKATPGRRLVGPGVRPTVPQSQKSKGWLVMTAALELSQNRVTHFYSPAKNTAEMMKMAQLLLKQYRGMKTLYLSWDAASWHMSKELRTFVDDHNAKNKRQPRLELVPLPASAQFLNIIESVFSGMSRAIIHNSNYASLDEAKAAIDRYFRDRNRHYAEHPKRAGKKLWSKERTEVVFDSSNNCKDPTYR
jgi:transposase